MAKTIRDKYDLLTLAIKNQLIGSEIIFENDTSLEIIDFVIDYRTDMIYLYFIDGTGDMFSLNDKYFVKVDETYKSVKYYKKKKKHKKQK